MQFSKSFNIINIIQFNIIYYTYVVINDDFWFVMGLVVVINLKLQTGLTVEQYSELADIQY